MNALPLLILHNATIRFGGLVAVSELDLELGAGDLAGLIGPNGAGKTTVFNLITGVYRPTAGDIGFDGRSIIGYKPYQAAMLGIARTFQNIRLFPSLTVYETIQTALRKNIRYGFFGAIARAGRFHAEEQRIHDSILEILEYFNLLRFQDSLAVSLPYGSQRRVEIVRALATRPRLLLLDEPAAGMNPAEKADLMELISGIPQKFNCAVLLIEHDMRVVMGICRRIAVLDYGVKIAEGPPEVIQKDPRVIEAYLGEQV